MRQMEEAALKAYAQDINNGLDITTQELNATAAAAAANFEDGGAFSVSNSSMPGPSAMPIRQKPVDPLAIPEELFERDEKKRDKKRKAPTNTLNDSTNEQSMWVEAKNDDGYSYYWNVKTGGSLRFRFKIYKFTAV